FLDDTGQSLDTALHDALENRSFERALQNLGMSNVFSAQPEEPGNGGGLITGTQQAPPGAVHRADQAPLPLGAEARAVQDRAHRLYGLDVLTPDQARIVTALDRLAALASPPARPGDQALLDLAGRAGISHGTVGERLSALFNLAALRPDSLGGVGEFRAAAGLGPEVPRTPDSIAEPERVVPLARGQSLTAEQVDIVGLRDGPDGAEIGAGFPLSATEAAVLRSAFEHGAASHVAELFDFPAGSKPSVAPVHFSDGRFLVRAESGVVHSLDHEQMTNLWLSAGRSDGARSQQRPLLWLSCELGDSANSAVSQGLRDLLSGHVGEQWAPVGRPELFERGGVKLRGDGRVSRLGEEPENAPDEAGEVTSGPLDGESVALAGNDAPFFVGRTATGTAVFRVSEVPRFLRSNGFGQTRGLDLAPEVAGGQLFIGALRPGNARHVVQTLPHEMHGDYRYLHTRPNGGLAPAPWRDPVFIMLHAEGNGFHVKIAQHGRLQSVFLEGHEFYRLLRAMPEYHQLRSEPHSDVVLVACSSAAYSASHQLVAGARADRDTADFHAGLDIVYLHVQTLPNGERRPDFSVAHNAGIASYYYRPVGRPTPQISGVYDYAGLAAAQNSDVYAANYLFPNFGPFPPGS
ncbi:MAG: hypothetical protein IJH84_14750, partial [Saccharopolyspora sp.]|uniref:hypothetical protein n=1 Tax=Saccharopolyspora sp. TaxID=33915 RepID=UPI0025D77CAA